jgi:26S proteasome regulatory subunit N2
MTAAVLPSSAAGLLTLLADDNDELKHYALVHLNKVVHEFWFQIASYIGSVEALYEDDEFKDRELAALIASKVLWGLSWCRAVGRAGSLCRAVSGIQAICFWQ